jgi:hypothetical protein
VKKPITLTYTTATPTAAAAANGTVAVAVAGGGSGGGGEGQEKLLLLESGGVLSGGGWNKSSPPLCAPTVGLLLAGMGGTAGLLSLGALVYQVMGKV